MRPADETERRAYDVIVVGVGGMGSATVYNLARRGSKVLGLEKFDIPHELGSSHGFSRIIRLAYWENEKYVPLVRRAYELWRELENRIGERLLFITWGIDAGLKNSKTFDGALSSCIKHHIPHEVLNAATLANRFPAYRLPSEMVGVYQPDAGFLLPERCIVGFVMAAQSLGAEVHARERVLAWQADSEGVEVTTDRRTYRASKMVITAGPWAGTVVPALKGLLVAERQVLIWTQPLRPEYFRLGAFPVFNLESDEGRFYGFPVYGVPGFKLGKYNHRCEQVHPDRMDRECYPEDEEVLRDAIRRYFPDADGPTMAMKPCIFTNTEDGNFILDFHPEFSRVAVAAGFSGHGFKFCSVVGQIMTELILDGKSELNEDMFRMRQSRFDNVGGS